MLPLHLSLFATKQRPLLIASLGHTLASHPLIQEVHNSFSKSVPFTIDQISEPEEKEDAYHFVAYLPVNGVLYELDGLRPSPIMHAAVEDEWLEQASGVINARIATYPPSSVSSFYIRSAPNPTILYSVE
jgi:ubiquitin carboxyl-terminal hydrolase L5